MDKLTIKETFEIAIDSQIEYLKRKIQDFEKVKSYLSEKQLTDNELNELAEEVEGIGREEYSTYLEIEDYDTCVAEGLYVIFTNDFELKDKLFKKEI